MNQQLDKTIRSEILPVYENMKARAVMQLTNKPKDTVNLIDYVYIDGRKITCALYLARHADGVNVSEQFEYYEYLYFHSANLETEFANKKS